MMRRTVLEVTMQLTYESYLTSGHHNLTAAAKSKPDKLKEMVMYSARDHQRTLIDAKFKLTSAIKRCTTSHKRTGSIGSPASAASEDGTMRRYGPSGKRRQRSYADQSNAITASRVMCLLSSFTEPGPSGTGDTVNTTSRRCNVPTRGLTNRGARSPKL